MSISDFSLYRNTLRFLIALRLGYHPYIMRPPKFIYIPFVNIPSLLTPATPHIFWLFDIFITLFYAVFLCSVRFRHIWKAHQSLSFNEACVFTLAHYGLLTRYQRTRTSTSRFMPSRGVFLSFHYRPNSQLTEWIFTCWYINTYTSSWRTRLHRLKTPMNHEFFVCQGIQRILRWNVNRT